MATIDSLANETLCKIMGMLKRPSSGWDDPDSRRVSRYRALRAAALVCSRWRGPAQRALFEEVEITYLHPLRPQRFLASPAQLLHPTRSLEVDRGQDLFQIAAVCEGLQELTFTSAQESWDRLAAPCFAGLKHIAMPISQLREPPRPGVSLPMSLTSLALWIANLNKEATSLMAALTSASKDSLEKLHLRIYFRRDDVNMSLALLDIGPRLHTLVIEATHAVLSSCLDMFPILEALQFFSWSGYDPARPLRACDTAHLHAILDAFPFPSTLRHLSIGTSDFSSLEHMSSLLIHPTLTRLTRLDFPSLLASSTPSAQASVVATMAKACKSGRIRLSLGGVEA